MPFNPEKLAKMIAGKSKSSNVVRTGGRGTVRRKHKAVRKAATQDDKRLKSTLNRLNVRDIPAIEEVNLFKEDGNVIHFVNPKVQASIAANTYVVSGHAETKKLQDLLPGIINQLGPDNLEHLKKVYASFAAKGSATARGAPGGAAGGAADDDDDVPELVENFEDAAKKTQDAPRGGAAASNAAGGGDDLPELVPAAADASQPPERPAAASTTTGATGGSAPAATPAAGQAPS